MEEVCLRCRFFAWGETLAACWDFLAECNSWGAVERVSICAVLYFFFIHNKKKVVRALRLVAVQSNLKWSCAKEKEDELEYHSHVEPSHARVRYKEYPSIECVETALLIKRIHLPKPFCQSNCMPPCLLGKWPATWTSPQDHKESCRLQQVPADQFLVPISSADSPTHTQLVLNKLGYTMMRNPIN